MASSTLQFDVTALDRASATFLALSKTIEKLERKLDDLDRAKAEPTVDVDTAKAERKVGAFTRSLKKQVEAALKSLPDLELDADASDAQREIQAVRRELAELASKDIGVDLDAGDAVRQAEALQRRLAELNREGVDIDVRADASVASAALEALQRQVAKLDGAAAEVDVDVDTAQAERNVGSFAAGLHRSISQAIQTLPDIDIDADSSDAEVEIAAIRADLQELSSQRIGIDVDAALAQARVDDLGRRLRELSGSTGSIQLDADTAQAAAKLGAVQEQLRSVDGRTANARVDIDTSAAFAAVSNLGRVMAGLALGGGVLAAVPQLASLASAAVAAAGALGAIPAAVGAGGAAFGAVKIGLTGLSDAFDAMGKSSTSAGGAASSSASQQEAAAQRIRSAEQSLSDAREQAARSAITSAQAVAAAQQGVSDAIRQADERAVDSARQVAQARAAVGDAVEAAARRVEAAEATLERAQVSARDAQEALNRAREDARERIEDLSLALSGAALDEESAQIRLERAQERMAKLSRTGGSALDMREAALGVRQAQQALLEVRERYGDIKQESAEANAKGVEGADNVVAAQRRVSDANRAVTDAERGLAQTRADGQKSIAAAQDRLTQAQEAQRRSAEDSARSIARAEDNLAKARQQQAWAQQDSAKAIARAQQQVADAVKSASDSAGAGASKIDAYADALSKLSPNARAFVEQIKALKPRWDELTRAVQNNLFAGVAEQTKRLADQYLPRLQGLFGSIATSANRSAIDIAKFFAQDAVAERMQGAFDRIGKAIDTASQAALPLVEVLTTVFEIGTEFLGPMAEDFKLLADRMAEFARSAEGQNKIREWIGEGIETLKQFGELLWNVGGIISTVFGAADANGVDFLGTLVALTGQVKEFLRSPEGNDLLTTVFASIKETIDNLKPGLMAVWDGIKDAVAAIAPKIPGVAESFSRIAEKLAPILSDIAVGVFNAFAWAFDVLSRVPAPVLIAAGGLFLAIAGLVKAGGAIKQTVDMFDALGKAKDHVGVIADKLRDIFRQTGGKKGALKEALLGADGCTSTRACLDEVNDKLGKNNDELDKTKKKSGGKKGKLGKLGGLGGALGLVAAGAGGAIAADELLPEQVSTGPQAARDNIGKMSDVFQGGGSFGDKFDVAKWVASPTQLAIDTLSTAIGNFFTSDIAPRWNAFWDGLGTKVSEAWSSITMWATEGWNGFTGWLSEQWTGFTTSWNGFWDGLGTKVSGLWDQVTGWVQEKWNGFTTWMSEQWAGFTAGWNGFWDGIGTWAATTWDNIKTWVQERWTGLTTWLDERWTAFKDGWNRFWDDAGLKVQQIWDGIKLWISTKWTEMTTWLSARWEEFKAGWNGMWDTVSRYFSDRWEDIKRIASGAWTWLRDTVWTPLVRFVTEDIPRSFDRAVEAIRIAWDKIKEIAAVPVRFVVGTVYNGGIVPAWNSLAKIVGLPEARGVDLKFAAGGVLPGYTPGRDVHTFYSPTAGTLGLSGGEAIMRPEVTRGMGPGWVDTVNAIARTGGAKAVQQYLGNSDVHEYASGGVAGFSGSGSATATRTTATGSVQASGLLERLFSDAAGAARSAFSGALGQAGSTPGQGQWRDAVARIPGKLVDAAVEKIKDAAKSLIPPAPAGGGLGGGIVAGQVGAMMNILRGAFPGLALISGFRPGAITATGNRSYHSMGRAVDIPPRMDVFNWIRSNYGARTRELIFSPAGGAQINNGRPHMYIGITRSNHWDHVHWAYRNGGIVPPNGLKFDGGGLLPSGTSLATNLTGRPERILSAQQTASFDRLVASLDRGGRVRGSDGGSLLDLDPVVGQLRALRGDVDQGGYFGELIGEVRALRQELAAPGGSAVASAQSARTLAELGAF